jgi:PAS domain S-box-containing protein
LSQSTTGAVVLQTLVRAMLAALAYFVSARLGAAIALPHNVAAIWPPSGVMLALLVLSDRQHWPALVGGGFAGALVSVLLYHYPLPLALTAATANSAESLLAAWVIRWRYDSRTPMHSVAGLVRFIVGAVILSNAVTALLGGFMLHQRFGTAFGTSWFTWWVGDGLGMLIVAPVLLQATRLSERIRTIELRAAIEAAVLLTLLFVAAHVTLGPRHDWLLEPSPYTLLPLLFWTALRFGPPGAATGLLIVASVAIWNVVLGLGPYWGNGAPEVSVAMHVYTFLLMASLSSLIPAAVLEERNAIIRRLLDSEERYRDLFESSPDPSWVYDTDTRAFLEVNQAAVTHYGYSRAEFLRLSIFDIHPEDDAGELPYILAHSSTVGALQHAARNRRKDGSILDVELNSHPLVFAGHRARLVHAHDVTERRRADDALRAAQERLRRVIASSGAVIFELRSRDGALELEWISENVSRILGYTLEETRQPKWWSSNVHPDDFKRMRGRPFAEAFMDGTSEYRLRHRDGKYRWLREEQRVTRNSDHKPVAVVGAWLDITDSRQLEQQLQQSQKLQAIGQLAGGVAHDFNNILTVILAEAGELLSTAAPRNAADLESIEEIRKAGERAAALTRQLLTFSRRQIVEPETVDINEIVVGMDKMLRRLIGEHVQMNLQLKSRIHCTVADRGQLEQLFVNLVVNARDAKGTGLGLATSYAIARQFGGHIAVYSEVGLGTTMRVYLPVSEIPPDVGRSSPTGLAQLRGHETILLVEDESQVRRVSLRMLQAAGYVVHEVASAEDAIALLTTSAVQFDLLLTDVVLPRMGGGELAEQASKMRPGIRVLFTSGYSADTVLQRRLLERDVVLLQKPFTTESLAGKVREALDRP